MKNWILIDDKKFEIFIFINMIKIYIYIGYTKNPKRREYHHRQKYGNVNIIIIDEVEEHNKKQLENFYIELKTQERIIRDSKGNDIGVRENQRGAMYIDHKVFFSLTETKNAMQPLRDSQLVKDIRAKRDKRNKK